MSVKRWLPTFLAFPLGGLIAIEAVGSLDGPATAAAGGLILGAAAGFGQWLALRGRAIATRWAVHTAIATAAGATLAVTVTDAGTGVADVMAFGLVSGAVVGAAQAVLLGRGTAIAAGWTALSAAAWSLGWLATSQIIVDIERGYHSFGASGAAVVTVVMALTLERFLAPAPAVAAVRPATAVGG